MCLQNLKRFELMKKVRFLTFFLKKFENRLKTALFKIDKFELMLVLEIKQKTALDERFEFSGRAWLTIFEQK